MAHSEETKREVIRLRATGMSFSKIAQATGVSRSAAHYVVQSNDAACQVAIEAAPAPNPRVPFPSEPSIAGPLASQAIEFRKLGHKNRTIASRLGVTVTQVAVWTYGVPKTPAAPSLDAEDANERKRAGFTIAGLKAERNKEPNPLTPEQAARPIPDWLGLSPPEFAVYDAAQAIAADDALLPPPVEEPTWVPAGDTAIMERRPYDVAAYHIPSNDTVGSHIDWYGIDSGCVRWPDIERDHLLSIWRTVKHLLALDEAEAEAAAVVEKPSLWVRVLRFIGLR